MPNVKLTCPFTGVSFEAIENADGSLIIRNPLSGAYMRVFNNDGFLNVPLEHFEYRPTMNCIEAAEYLGVTKTRIYAIAKNNIVCSHEVNGKTVFLEDDIIEYAKNRTVGRPRKG